jgi:UTP-glucose-1-phosphate uridylyltransferase
MTLVIMAAGMGNRYGGLKQIDPVGPNGEFIIDYSIYDAIKAGCNRVVFIIKEENYDIFRETVGKRIEGKIQVDYAFQRKEDIPFGKTPDERVKPWGTSHAVLACRDIVKENFMVINADDFYGWEAYKVVFDYPAMLKENNASNYCMPGYILKNTLSDYGHVARGICKADKNGYLEHIVERKKIMRNNGIAQYADKKDNWHDIDEDSVVSMNFWGFTPSVFGLLEEGFYKFLSNPETDLINDEYLLAPAIGEMITDKKANVRIINTNAKWFGVTYQADKPMVAGYIRELIEKGEYPENLWVK